MENTMTKCELCSEQATVQVTWASDKAPWSASMCHACMRAAWDKCSQLGNTDGWCMVPIKSNPATIDPVTGRAL